MGRKGRSWLPQEEPLRKLQAGKSANASQRKASPDPLQAECKRLLKKKPAYMHSSQTKLEIQKETYAILTTV